MEVFLTPQFYLDVAEELIWLLEKAGAEVATSWHESVDDTITQLTKHPFIGRERKELRGVGIRSWRVSNFPRWLIFYAVEDQKRLILHRVRQGSMDLTVLRIKT